MLKIGCGSFGGVGAVSGGLDSDWPKSTLYTDIHREISPPTPTSTILFTDRQQPPHTMLEDHHKN